MFSNPKRIKAKATAKEGWFDYYAGYSSAFVKDVLPHILPSPHGRVLDPWNGSGTTTTTAAELGISSTGIDINPVMVVVARAKLLTPGVLDSLAPLANDIIDKARQSGRRIDDADPLRIWFRGPGSRTIRSLVEATCRLLIPNSDDDDRSYKSSFVDSVSDIAAFFLVALFRTTRSLLSGFRSTNPTWIKSPTADEHRLSPAPETVFTNFHLHVREMAEGIVPVSGRAETVISLGSSDHLPIGDKSVEAVISSPPYCTRIDYAVATKPELAVLGCPVGTGFKELRRRMIGSPVVLPIRELPETAWGDECLRFLEAVKIHPSKGSANYYHKLFVQYFAAIHNSLREIDRVLTPGGQCVLVVQDSFYKELHVDIARHLVEMASGVGWSLSERIDFETNMVMARLNPKAKKYRRHTSATESVLSFQTAS